MSNGETVLVVEDEALILFTIADELRKVGYRVLEAHNADEAVRILETDRSIQLIFTDIDMPGSMDGLRLAAVVSDRWPPVRILVTSGKRAPAQAEMPLGSRFLPKPYTPTGVVETVRGLLS